MYTQVSTYSQWHGISRTNVGIAYIYSRATEEHTRNARWNLYRMNNRLARSGRAAPTRPVSS